MNHKRESIKWMIYWIIFSFALHPIFIVRADVSKLPLIALQTTQSKYEIPKCLRKNSSQQLEYYLPEEDSETVYFCPKSTKSYLLYPTKKEICETEPTPRLRRASDEESKETDCPNIRYIRTLYTYGYQVAYSKNFKEKNEDSWDDWKNIYTFCFHHVERGIIHFSYQISSPNLLTSDFLKDEHKYIEKKYRTSHFNDEVLRQYILRISTRYSDYDRKVPENRQAMIMTPNDMAFAVWKKPFMHLINYTIFSNTLITSQWAQIGIFIRGLATQGWGELHIKVGMMHYNTGNLYRIWWKLVITQDEAHAIAIIVHDYTIMERSSHREFTCQTTCEQLGFDGMVSPLLRGLVFCCPPDIITNRIEGFKSYGLFNLKDQDAILKPLEVKCDSESRTTE